MARRRAEQKPDAKEQSILRVAPQVNHLYDTILVPAVHAITHSMFSLCGEDLTKWLAERLSTDLSELTGGMKIAPRAYDARQTRVKATFAFAPFEHCNIIGQVRYTAALPTRFTFGHDVFTLQLTPTACREIGRALRNELAILRPLALRMSALHQLNRWTDTYTNRERYEGMKRSAHIPVASDPEVYVPPSTILLMAQMLSSEYYDPPAGSPLRAALQPVPLRALSLAGEKLAALAAIGASMPPMDKNYTGFGAGVSALLSTPRPIKELMPTLLNAEGSMQTLGFGLDFFQPNMNYTYNADKLAAIATFWNFIASITDPHY